MSRHRRQPSRSLPLGFNVDVDDEPAPAKGTTAHVVDGGGQPGPSAGRATDAAKAQEGNGSKKLPPSATGDRPVASSEETGKKSCDGGGR
ncbi:hypothetical protein E2562_004153 [Oryza meyeriana var. granulata]|uniref:Uncharacterized protein n=1 Tax=Oryza meyeriana var. granulata TaxID=110450 RepID=A0A6G1BQI6_9ORYZ|nr:hypothetical protein E2562_004153 [Oryza meyeriana var. granulata]